MTILNTSNNVSEDYIYVVNASEIFYETDSLPFSIYTYEDGWVEVPDYDASSFESEYRRLQNIIVENSPHQIIKIGGEETLDDLRALVEDNNKTYFCLGRKREDDERGFPHDETSDIDYFIVVLTSTDGGGESFYIPIKSSLSSNMKIVRNSNYTPSSNEYLSAIQTSCLIGDSDSSSIILSDYYDKEEIDAMIGTIRDLINS